MSEPLPAALPYTQPLQLRSRLRSPRDLGWNFIPLVDLAIIGLLLGLHAYRFVYTPGPQVDLPRIPSATFTTSVSPAILTLGRQDMLFFQGQKVLPEALDGTLREYAALHSPPPPLLVKMDASLSVQDLADILATARAAGFPSIHLAAEDAPRVSPDALLP